MTADQKWQWMPYINPEGIRKYERVKKPKKQKAGTLPPEPEIPNEFLELSRVKPTHSHGSTQAAHIAEALEEKEG